MRQFSKIKETTIKVLAFIGTQLILFPIIMLIYRLYLMKAFWIFTRPLNNDQFDNIKEGLNSPDELDKELIYEMIINSKLKLKHALYLTAYKKEWDSEEFTWWREFDKPISEFHDYLVDKMDTWMKAKEEKYFKKDE